MSGEIMSRLRSLGSRVFTSGITSTSLATLPTIESRTYLPRLWRRWGNSRHGWWRTGPSTDAARNLLELSLCAKLHRHDVFHWVVIVGEDTSVLRRCRYVVPRAE